MRYLYFIEMDVRDWPCETALERRHDGPLPPVAALPPDYASPWPEQLLNRRRWAWRDVRRIGHRLVHAGRAARNGAGIYEYREWQRLRRELAFALRSWKCYRDWAGAVTPVRRSATPRPDP